MSAFTIAAAAPRAVAAPRRATTTAPHQPPAWRTSTLAPSGRLSSQLSGAIGGAALERFPQAPLRAALEMLAQEIDASPRLVVRAAGLDDQARSQIEQACADSGFTGVVAFRDEPGLGSAALRLEWADGRADHDPDGCAQRVAEALTAALAAEAGHAEPPIAAERSEF